MEKCFVVHSPSLGDTLCSTPTLRKVSKSYGEKLHVATHLPEIFSNNPCVKSVVDIKSFKKNKYETFETFRNIGKKDKKGVEKKHNTIDIRQFHAMDLGFNLLPEEMECEFYPDACENLHLPTDYICIHPTQTWESRTWAKEKWQELVNELIRMGICIVLVGKDSQEFGFWDIEKPTFDIEGEAKVINLLNKTNLSSTWNVINNASCFITMDSGLLHLAGTTDTHIIQLGSSINYKLRAPYRKGFQGYKYDYMGGTCGIFCGSDMKYGIKEWGTIHGVPPIIRCLEDKPTYECHPSVNQVIDQLSKNNIKIFQNRNKDKKKILYLAPHLSTGGSPEWLRKAIESIKDDFKIFVVEFSFYAESFVIQREKIIEMIGEENFYSLGSVFDKGETHIENRWKLIDIINEIQPDVVHINEMPEVFEYDGFPDEILDELYRENRNYQIYETSHSSTCEPDKQKRYIPDGFIFCSPLHLNQYKNFDVPQYLAEYPVEKKERPNRKKALEGLGLDPFKKHVLQVGLFTHLKNQKYTFELASATQNLNIQYHFVGNDCWKEGCRIPDEHISLQNCKLWGERSDVDVFMSCMDILIFPSLIELNPIVLKEADSWDMKILLNSLSAYGDTYEENQNVINLKLDVDKDKKAIQYAHMYCPKDGNDGNSRNFFLWEEIIETQIYEKKFKVKEDDIVLDMGANIGFFAASCSQRNINRCYCFEPMEENFKYLQKNINNLIDCEKFELINKAVSPNPEIYIPSGVDQDTPHAISVLERLPNSFSPYAVEEKEDDCLVIPAIKLSDFLEENKIEKIDFLKMDIEGGEWDIFEDAKEFEALLSKTEKFVAEIHVRLGTSIETKFKKDFIEKFKNSGFEISMGSLDGVNITNIILHNHYLSKKEMKAHDYYHQFMFYAWRK